MEDTEDIDDVDDIIEPVAVTCIPVPLASAKDKTGRRSAPARRRDKRVVIQGRGKD